MHATLAHRGSPRADRRAAVLTAVALAAVLTPVSTAAAAAPHSPARPPAGPASTAPLAPGPVTETVRFPAHTATVRVAWRGNGHGHGMSQYGARGAAMAGLSAAQIVAFYYPGTRLVVQPATIVRVLLSGTGPTTVYAGAPRLSLTGYGLLPRTGVQLFRLVPDGAGLDLLAQPTGSSRWQPLRSGLPSGAVFSSRQRFLRVQLADGSSTRYRGRISTVRSGSGELTINRVLLDGYVQGVAAREMPSSWQPAALQAQAIAARSYAAAEMAVNAAGAYDICDNTYCQVYGGMAHLAADGTVLWRDFPPALAGNENAVLTYSGAPIFAQYSASDGGASADGGQPYLLGKADPYDNSASGDPYLDESRTVPARQFAAAFGLVDVAAVTITRRCGYGPWGGRIISATVAGHTAAGASQTVTATGADLGDAVGLYTDYLRLSA